jgi:hypothetical protein
MRRAGSVKDQRTPVAHASASPASQSVFREDIRRRRRVLGTGGGQKCEAGRPQRFRVAAGPGLPARRVPAGLAAKRRTSPTAVPLKGRKPHRFRPSTLAVIAPAGPSVAPGGEGRELALVRVSRAPAPFRGRHRAANGSIPRTTTCQRTRNVMRDDGAIVRSCHAAHRGPTYRQSGRSQLLFAAAAVRDESTRSAKGA